MRGTSSFTSSTATSELRLAGAPLRLRLDRRAKRLRLRLDRRGDGLVLTIPAGLSRRHALAWAEAQQDWAARALSARPERAALVAGATVSLLGEPHVIVHRAGPRSVVRDGSMLRVGGPLETVEARLLRWLQREALSLLAAETEEMAGRLGMTVAAVGIGDPRTRWGSCSSRGRIRYSWRLVLMPDFVRRAVVAHEVAHLRHMDHKAHFHALVAELLGADPRPATAWLRANGRALHRIGPA